MWRTLPEPSSEMCLKSVLCFLEEKDCIVMVKKGVCRSAHAL